MVYNNITLLFDSTDDSPAEIRFRLQVEQYVFVTCLTVSLRLCQFTIYSDCLRSLSCSCVCGTG
jgi:hypothetical protein